MHGPKNTGDFPVASTTKRRLRYDVSVTHKSHRLNVVSISKESEMPLQQQISQYPSTVCQNIRMYNKLFLSSKPAEQYHIHVVTVEGSLAHVLCLLQVANCENN